MLRYLRTCKGLSLIELIVTMIILGILAGGVVPIVRMTAQRTKELELRRNLRTIRAAIDEFHKECKKTPLNSPLPEVCSSNNYPKTLDILVKGADFKRSPQPEIKRFLRRKICDPLVSKDICESSDKWGWELRSSNYIDLDDTWNDFDVFDIYTLNEGTTFDGYKYKDL